MTILRNRTLQRLSLPLLSEAQLRSRFISLVQTYLPEVTDLNDSSTLVRIGDLFTAFFVRYGLNTLNDIVNEAFIGTASRYDFIATLSKMLGYFPSPGSASSALVTVSNSAQLAVAIRRSDHVFRTKRSGDTPPIEFELLTGTEIIPAMGSASFYVVQGTTIWNETIGTGDGTDLQVFVSARARAVDGSERVYVDGERWDLAPLNNLMMGGENDKIYQRWHTEYGNTVLLFGTGSHGKRPASGSVIVCSYRIIIDGQNGNVPVGSIVELSPSNNYLTVTNAQPASGWSAPDSLEDIRFKATRAVRVPYRQCVSEDDTEANVESEFRSSVGRCYTVPGERGENTIGIHVMDSEGNNVSAATKSDVRAFVEATNPATERAFVGNAQFTDLQIFGYAYHDESYVSGSAIAAIYAAFHPLAYDANRNRAVGPGEVIRAARIVSVVMAVPGVTNFILVYPTTSINADANSLPRVYATIVESLLE